MTKPNFSIVESYSSSTYSDIEFTRAIVGDQGNVYIFGKASSPEHTIIQKRNSTGSVLYSTITELIPSPLAFDVGISETRLFAFLRDGANGYLVTYQGSDGALEMSRSVTFLPTSDSIIVEDPRGFTIFFTVGGTTSAIIRACPWDSSRDCYTILSSISLSSTTGAFGISLFLDDNNSVLLSLTTNTQPISRLFKKFDFSASGFEIWASEMTCPDSNCDSESISILHDETNSKFYVATQYDSNILFFELSDSDGSLIGDIYSTPSSLTCAGLVSITESSSFVYIL